MYYYLKSQRLNQVDNLAPLIPAEGLFYAEFTFAYFRPYVMSVKYQMCFSKNDHFYYKDFKGLR